MNPETKTCKNCSASFTIEPDDFMFYEKIGVPPPTLCPRCRAQRRMTWWNEHNLYRKKDAHDGKEVFSTYPEHSPVKIYDHDYWWSDAWDPMSFGREYDFSRPFFEQFRDLLHTMPRASREIKSLVNSDFSDNATQIKNCYLCFDASFSEDLLYCISVTNCTNSMDIYQADRLDLCYELLQCIRSFETFFSHDCENCRNVWLSRDCLDCDNCFGCANLRHKKYYIFNEPYTKEAYEKKMIEFDLGSFKSLKKLKKQAQAVWKANPYRFMHGTQNTNVSGDYIEHCKNTFRSFQVDDSSDVKYSQRIIDDCKWIVDMTNWGDQSELMYECVVCGENNRNLKFCAYCWPANRDLEYCMSCHNSSDLFGCIGLRKKQYCILNRQFSKDEYFRQLTLVKGQMLSAGEYGEFFPTSMSPFAYNESVAIDYFPVKKEEALSAGFAWRDHKAREYKITVQAVDLPDHIRDVSKEITKAIIGCMTCKHAYRILDRELEFYKRFSIPVPRKCHDCRHTERLQIRTSLAWFDRKCDKCGIRIETNAGSPDREKIVYCETCYQQEVL